MLLNSFSLLPKLFRFSNWWHYKIPPLVAIFFFALTIVGENDTSVILVKLVLLIGWMLAAASFGYFINDWNDIEEDRLAGKHNSVAGIKASFRWLIAIVLVLATLLFQFFLNGIGSLPFILSIFHLAFFLLYSVPPFRFKQYLFRSIICDSLYAHLLPVAIVFTSVCSIPEYRLAFTLLCVWQFIYGIRNILLHHIFDRKYDARSGNNNFANRFHPLIILKLINRILFPLDILFAFSFFYVVNVYVVIVVVVLILFRLFLVKIAWRITRLWSNQKMSYWLLNDVYEGYIPFISILVFALSNAKIFILLCVVYPFVFPQFMAGLANDKQHIAHYLKSKFGR